MVEWLINFLTIKDPHYLKNSLIFRIFSILFKFRLISFINYIKHFINNIFSPVYLLIEILL